MKKATLMMAAMICLVSSAYAEFTLVDEKHKDGHRIVFMANKEFLENEYNYSVGVIKDGTHILRVYVTDDLEKAANFYESGYYSTLYNDNNRGKLLEKEFDAKRSIVSLIYEMK